MKPKTPLPWKAWPLGDITGPDHQRVTDVYPPHHDDADYITHACNAYPKLENTSRA
jgi:hypothetical protein